MRVMDFVEDDLRAEAEEWHKNPPRRHWASRASGYWLCTVCKGAGKDAGETCKACSGMGRVLDGPCLRQEYFRYLGMRPTDPVEPGALLKMRTGDIIEEMMLDYAAKHAAIARQVRFRWQDERLILEGRGRADAIEILPEGGLSVWENKSKYGRGIRRVRREGVPADEWAQAAFAVRFVQERFPGHKIVHVRFLYEARDDCDRIEYEFTQDEDGWWVETKNGTLYMNHRRPPVEDVIEQSILRWQELERYLTDLVLPPAEYRNWELPAGHKKQDWHCRYCSWAGLCEERENALRAAEEEKERAVGPVPGPAVSGGRGPEDDGRDGLLQPGEAERVQAPAAPGADSNPAGTAASGEVNG